MQNLISFSFCINPDRNNEALVHLIKATIGGGFLAMPEAFHNAGWLIGLVGTVLLGLAVLNMMSTIVSINATVS